MRRIYNLLLELEAQGIISTTSPKKINESDIGEIIGWFKANLDATTASHYMKFLDEVLQSVGNNVLSRLKVKRRHLLPRPMNKSISVIPSDTMDILLAGGYTLEDKWWDATAKAAIALAAHTGLRSSELRLAKVEDLDLTRLEIRVSSPKGKGRWANGNERTPIMPGCEDTLRAYLDQRRERLEGAGKPDHEALFPFIPKKGEIRSWSIPMWTQLKKCAETASGQRFRWKDFRPTYAQSLKDADAPIEAISRCLRHTSTKTTEQYYGRIRPESAFSQVRAAWQARKPLPSEI
jgi:integrase